MSRLKRVQKNNLTSKHSTFTPSHKAPSTTLSKTPVVKESLSTDTAHIGPELSVKIIGLSTTGDTKAMAAIVAEVQSTVLAVSNGGTKHRKLLSNLQALYEMLNSGVLEPSRFDSLCGLIVGDLQRV
jgi:hypothetical protein